MAYKVKGDLSVQKRIEVGKALNLQYFVPNFKYIEKDVFLSPNGDKLHFVTTNHTSAGTYPTGVYAEVNTTDLVETIRFFDTFALANVEDILPNQIFIIGENSIGNYAGGFINKGTTKVPFVTGSAGIEQVLFPKGGNRLKPVATIVEMTALIAEDNQFINANNKDYVFSKTIHLTPREIADGDNIADDANSGKWVLQERNMMKAPVADENALKLVKSPEDKEVRMNEATGIWNVFSDTATKGIAPTDGTVGFWIPAISGQSTGSVFSGYGLDYTDSATGTITASSYFGGNTASAGKMFDNNLTTEGWGNNNDAPSWIKYLYPASVKKKLGKITIFRSSAQVGWENNNYSPKDFKIGGIKDDDTIAFLKEYTGQMIAVDTTASEFLVDSDIKYKGHIIYDITPTTGLWMNITEMSFHEKIYTVGLRGVPIETLAELTALVPQDDEFRTLTATEKSYVFKKTARLTADEIANPNNIADDGNTGKWVLYKNATNRPTREKILDKVVASSGIQVDFLDQTWAQLIAKYETLHFTASYQLGIVNHTFDRTVVTEELLDSTDVHLYDNTTSTLIQIATMQLAGKNANVFLNGGSVANVRFRIYGILQQNEVVEPNVVPVVELEYVEQAGTTVGTYLANTPIAFDTVVNSSNTTNNIIYNSTTKKWLLKAGFRYELHAHLNTGSGGDTSPRGYMFRSANGVISMTGYMQAMTYTLLYQQLGDAYGIFEPTVDTEVWLTASLTKTAYNGSFVRIKQLTSKTITVIKPTDAIVPIGYEVQVLEGTFNSSVTEIITIVIPSGKKLIKEPELSVVGTPPVQMIGSQYDLKTTAGALSWRWQQYMTTKTDLKLEFKGTQVVNANYRMVLTFMNI